MWRRLLASMCVVASLLFSGCGPVLTPPDLGCCRPTIYAFSAPGCSGCIKDKPRVAQLEQAGCKVIRIDIAARPDWRKKYSVNAVPFYLVVRKGSIVLRTHDLNLVIQAVNNGCKIQEATLPQLSGD